MEHLYKKKKKNNTKQFVINLGYIFWKNSTTHVDKKYNWIYRYILYNIWVLVINMVLIIRGGGNKGLINSQYCTCYSRDSHGDFWQSIRWIAVKVWANVAIFLPHLYSLHYQVLINSFSFIQLLCFVCICWARNTKIGDLDERKKADKFWESFCPILIIFMYYMLVSFKIKFCELILPTLINCLVLNIFILQ